MILTDVDTQHSAFVIVFIGSIGRYHGAGRLDQESTYVEEDKELAKPPRFDFED